MPGRLAAFPLPAANAANAFAFGDVRISHQPIALVGCHDTRDHQPRTLAFARLHLPVFPVGGPIFLPPRRHRPKPLGRLSQSAAVFVVQQYPITLVRRRNLKTAGAGIERLQTRSTIGPCVARRQGSHKQDCGNRMRHASAVSHRVPSYLFQMDFSSFTSSRTSVALPPDPNALTTGIACGPGFVRLRVM